MIHHTKSPFQALQNISNACNQNGIVWLYHYQPTSLSFIYADTLRKIFKKRHLEYLNTKLIKRITRKNISSLIDDLVVIIFIF